MKVSENKEVHIAVANNKGGVAKTLMVINLAQAFADKGKRVVVIVCAVESRSEARAKNFFAALSSNFSI